MSPSFIVAIVVGFFKLTPEFRRNLTAEQALEASNRAKAKKAKQRVQCEWTQVNAAIRRETEAGSGYVEWSSLFPENEKRLIVAGYIVDRFGIRWDKKG